MPHMQAYVVRAPGGREVLERAELPVPQAPPGWVRIRVRAFGLNRAEVMTRQGHSGDAVPWPRVIGIECVGEIDDPGDSGLAAGQTVATCMGGLGRAHDGSYAQYTVVPASQVIPLTTSLPWERLGALPESYLTAWGVVDKAMGIGSGEVVVVRAASSSVGRAAMALLKLRDCTVVATTRSPAKAERLEAMGADHVLVTSVDLADEVKRQWPAGVHGVVELVGTRPCLLDSLQACRPRGIVGLVGFLGYEWDYDWFPWMPSCVRLTMYDSETLTGAEATAPLQEVVDKVEAGELGDHIDRVLPFDELHEAHRVMEASEAMGKIVVTVP